MVLFRPLRLITLPLSLLSLLSACSSGSGPSEAEVRALQSTAFTTGFNVHERVGDVHSSSDALPASRPFHVNDITAAIEVPIRDCTKEGLYEMEKQMALNEAAADPTGQTVPVKFSYSFGKKHDALAKWANMRAVLSENNSGVSYIPVGGKTTAVYTSKRQAYYEVDNREVARQYRTGERCFFSTIHVDPSQLHLTPGKYDFIRISERDIDLSGDLLKSKKTKMQKMDLLRHMIHYMYYGYCRPGLCADGQAFAGEYANRLFSPVPSVDGGEPQIIKLYMADLRSEQMQYDIVKLSEDTTRGLEIDSSIDNILNVCEIHRNYHDVTKNLRLPAQVNGYEFDPIQGAVQLVENILSHDVDGTMLSSQYTPIVLDLNGDGVKTSSVRWGTYFNMAALADSDGVGRAHRTAWLGGDYVDYNQGGADPRVNMDVRLKSEDGFLVIPNDDNQVASSNQMFGDNITVGGKTYENGFQALQAFAGKNCSSSAVQDRYVGPWDGDIYENQLKVWVDENRNGLSEPGEVQSLRHHKVAAINACHIVHAEETDAFQNGTSLRSAALMAGPYEHLLDRPEEIVYQLQYGEGYEGEKAYFHLAIDLIFQVDTDKVCPGVPRHDEDYAAIDLGDDVGIGSDVPVPPTEEEDDADSGQPLPPDNF